MDTTTTMEPTMYHWNDSNVESTSTSKIINHDSIAFPIDVRLNEKISIWNGCPLELDIDGLVHSTNERFERCTRLSTHLYDNAGPELRRVLFNRIRSCPIGSVRITSGYQLRSRYILHTVGPHYQSRYRTAAENTLFNCYYNVLMAAKQYKIRRLALPSIAIDHFHYPKRDAIALAIRIIRRFMEHFSESFDSIILVADSVAESNLIIEMLSIYFPRTDNDCSIQLKMETFSPMMIGGRFGEPIHPERNIRIKENPIESLQFSQEWNLHSPSSSFCSTTSTSSDFTSSSSLNYYNSQTSNDEQFESSLTNSIGKTKFARMREHCRDSRFIRSGSQFDIEFDHSMFGDFHRKLRFERLCRNVRRKQLSSPTNVREHFFLDCAIYISGLDRHSRPILSIDCSRINELILTDRLLVHIIQLFEQLSHHQSFIIHIFNCNSLEIDTNIINFLYKLNSFITDSIRSKIDSILVTNYTIWNRLQFWLTKTKQYTENKLRKQKTNDPLIWLRSRVIFC